jgi:hypothetical protein
MGEEATAEKTMAEAATGEAATAEAAMAEAVEVAWDIAARDKNKHHGGRRGGKALLAEFLPNLQRLLPDYLTHQLDHAAQSPQPPTRSNLELCSGRGLVVMAEA